MKSISLTLSLLFLFVGTAFSQNEIQPLVNGHAHNDYAHKRPFLDAYENGFCSIEVDIFRVDDELYVAHDVVSLSIFKKRKLIDLYLDPLLKVVEENDGQVYPGHTEPVILLIDIKHDGAEVFKLLKQQLEDYRSMLCCIEDGVYQKRAVQIVLSGARPRNLIANDPDRIMAIDGRFSDLDSDLAPELMPLVSDHWGKHFKWRGEGQMPDKERQQLKTFVAAAKAANRKLRFWAAPDSQAVWRELAQAEVDLINTDDLEGLKACLNELQTSLKTESKLEDGAATEATESKPQEQETPNGNRTKQ